MFATGRYTEREVLAHVTGLGLTTTRGLPVSPQTFAQMLSRSLYSGFIETDSWGGVRAASQSDPIVDRATFLRVRALLNNDAPTTTAYQRNHPDFPLRVFVWCACGTPLTGSKTKKVYRYYHCRKVAAAPTSGRRKLEAEFSALTHWAVRASEIRGSLPSRPARRVAREEGGRPRHGDDVEAQDRCV
jgi:hypothetical protein